MLKKSSRIHKLKVPLLVAAALVVVGTGTYLLVNRYNTSKPPSIAPAGVNLTPATEQEKQESEDAKSRATEQEQQNQTPPTQEAGSKKKVGVVITYAGQDNVSAYVTGVFEEGGTCTAVFSQGSTTVTRTSTGFGNVSYTQCAPLSPNLPSTGSWSVVVSYNSLAAEGQSQAQAF